VSDLGSLESDVSVRFSFSQQRAAERDGERLRLLPFGPGLRRAEALAPLSTRRHDLVLGPPAETRLAYRYALPPGHAVSRLPARVRLEGPAVGFEVSYRVEGRELVAETRFTTREGTVQAADYPAFRAVLEQADRALSEEVWIEGGAVAGARP
jgi:hypothetical protein